MDLLLTKKDARKSSGKSGDDVVAVKVAERLVGLPVRNVAAIVTVEELTPIPLAPDVIRGGCVWQGGFVTAMDLGLRLGLAPVTEQTEQPAVIVEVDGLIHALLVDEIREVVSDDGSESDELNQFSPLENKRFCLKTAHRNGVGFPVLDVGLLVADEKEPVRDSPVLPDRPELRLVHSQADENQGRDVVTEEADREPLMSALGGSRGIDRIADEFAIRVFDDDGLNCYLGSLNALQFPSLIADYLTALMGVHTEQQTDETEAILRRHLLRQGFDDTHLHRVLGHVSDVLLKAHCSRDVVQSFLGILRSAGHRILHGEERGEIT